MSKKNKHRKARCTITIEDRSRVNSYDLRLLNPDPEIAVWAVRWLKRNNVTHEVVQTYDTRLSPEGHFYCECLGHCRYGHCKHVEFLTKLLGRLVEPLGSPQKRLEAERDRRLTLEPEEL